MIIWVNETVSKQWTPSSPEKNTNYKIKLIHELEPGLTNNNLK
jgi:hypothetical protein